jgi:hypothetical protein
VEISKARLARSRRPSPQPSTSPRRPHDAANLALATAGVLVGLIRPQLPPRPVISSFRAAVTARGRA